MSPSYLGGIFGPVFAFETRPGRSYTRSSVESWSDTMITETKTFNTQEVRTSTPRKTDKINESRESL